MLLSLRDALSRNVTVEWSGDRDSDRQPHVEQPRGKSPAPAVEQQRAEPEQGGGEQPAEEVVDAECGRAPAGRGAPGHRPGRDRVGDEGGGPGRKLGPATRAPAGGDRTPEPQREQRRPKGKERFHGSSLRLS